MDKIEQLLKLRDEIYSWAKIELLGKVIFNTEANMDILINNNGLKHTLKGKSFKKQELINKNEAMIMSVKYLKYFLETSSYEGFEKDKRKRDNILA